MKRFTLFLRHLLKPPDVHHAGSKMKMFLHQVRTDPSRSVGQSFRGFFRYFSVWMRTNRIASTVEKPARRNVFKLLLRRPKRLKAQGDPPALKNLLKSPRTVPKQKSQVLNVLSRAFKFQSGATFAKLRDFIKKQWIHFRILLTRPENPVGSSTSGIPSTRTIGQFFLRDAGKLRQRLFSSCSAIVATILLHWKTAVGSVFLFLFLFECFLQLTSLMIFPLLKLKQEVIQQEKLVLCIGDSFTESRIAQSGRYSDFLQMTLATLDSKNWKVLNFSSPYLSAEDLIHRIPEILEKHQPDFIYLMIGVNDLQTGKTDINSVLPPRPQAENVKRPWLRSPALIRKWRKEFSFYSLIDTIIVPPEFALEKLPLEGYSEANLKFTESQLSKTEKASQTVQKFPDSRSWYQSGNLIEFKEKTFKAEGSESEYFILENIFVQKRNGKESAYLWESDGNDLVLSGEDIEDVKHLKKERVSTPNRPIVEAERRRRSAHGLLQNKSLDLARLEFERAIELDAENALARAGLAQTLFELGQHKNVDIQIDWLLDRYKSDPNPVVARALLLVYPLENSPGKTSGIAIKILSKYPHNPWFWESLARCSYLVGRTDIAVRALQRALALTPEIMPRLKADLFRSMAETQASFAVQEALEDLASAFVLDGNEEIFINSAQRNALYYLHANFEQALSAISCPEEKKTILKTLFNGALHGELPRSFHLLESRLRQIVFLCQEHKAIPVLMTYPHPYSRIEEITRRVAEETGAGWLNITPKMESLVRTDSQRKIIKEGQFTDEARQRVAQWISDDVSFREPHLNKLRYEDSSTLSTE